MPRAPIPRATDEAKQQGQRSKYAQKDDTDVAGSAYSRYDGGIEPDQVTEDITTEKFEEDKIRHQRTYVHSVQSRERKLKNRRGSIAKMRETTTKTNKQGTHFTTLNSEGTTLHDMDQQWWTLPESST